MNPTITVETEVNAPSDRVWRVWTDPAHIVQWNAASADWHCPRAELDLRAGGRFCYRMEASDGSSGFDFEGEFTEIVPERRLAYRLGEDRNVVVEFASRGSKTLVREIFTAEGTHPVELQRAGWQSILDSFRHHAEGVI